MSPFASFWSYLPVPYANECFSSIGHCIKNLFAGIWFDGLFVYHDDFSFRIILKYLEVCMRRKERTEESEGKNASRDKNLFKTNQERRKGTHFSIFFPEIIQCHSIVASNTTTFVCFQNFAKALFSFKLKNKRVLQ